MSYVMMRLHELETSLLSAPVTATMSPITVYTDLDALLAVLGDRAHPRSPDELFLWSTAHGTAQFFAEAPLRPGEKVEHLVTGAAYRLGGVARHTDGTQTAILEPLADFEAFLSGLTTTPPAPLLSLPIDQVRRAVTLPALYVDCPWCDETTWHWRTTGLPDYLRCTLCRAARPLPL